MKKVFIADDQLISPLGFTSEENICALRNKRSGIKEHKNKEISPTPFYASMIGNEVLSNAFSKIGNPKEFTKLEQMLLLAVHGILERHPNLALRKTALIVSTTKGNIQVLSENSPFPKEKTKLYELGNTIQEFFKWKSDSITVSNACISGGLAIAVGKRCIQSGKYDHVIVVGGDVVSEFTFSGFTSFQAISDKSCQPFSKNRSGISLGEAAAGMLLSSDESMQKTDAIFVTGAGSANDANHISGPSRTGEGLFLSIKDALQEAKTTPEEIDYISAHGTATAFNDEMEAIAFDRASLLKTPVNSIKGFFGHTLGASGLLESIIAARSLQNNELYPSLGFDELGVSKPINIQQELESKNLKTALKTASGFGGCNVALVFQKRDRFLSEPEEKAYKNSLVSEVTGWGIQDFVHIKEDILFHKKEKVFQAEAGMDIKTFAKTCYSTLKMNYPKFHKMDNLCKLGMLASEVLFKNNSISENTALVLSNNASSLETDEKHQASIEDKENYFPSPAVFVYTLPNIVLGEISIKHGLKSEQVFFVSEKFDVELLMDYAEILLNTQKTEQVICGWIDLHNSTYNVFLCLISSTGTVPLTKNNLQKLYNQNYE